MKENKNIIAETITKLLFENCITLESILSGLNVVTNGMAYVLTEKKKETYEQDYKNLHKKLNTVVEHFLVDQKSINTTRGIPFHEKKLYDSCCIDLSMKLYDKCCECFNVDANLSAAHLNETGFANAESKIYHLMEFHREEEPDKISILEYIFLICVSAATNTNSFKSLNKLLDDRQKRSRGKRWFKRISEIMFGEDMYLAIVDIFTLLMEENTLQCAEYSYEYALRTFCIREEHRNDKTLSNLIENHMVSWRIPSYLWNDEYGLHVAEMHELNASNAIGYVKCVLPIARWIAMGVIPEYSEDLVKISKYHDGMMCLSPNPSKYDNVLYQRNQNYDKNCFEVTCAALKEATDINNMIKSFYDILIEYACEIFTVLAESSICDKDTMYDYFKSL